MAMNKRTDLEFVVRWYPFQLNPNAPQQGSKLEMYMNKFGIGKEEALGRGDWMGQKFKAVGLPFKFTETDLTGNTFDAHRVMTAAYQHGGPAAQDKAAEKLFHSYFAEGRAPSDPATLQAAAEAAGMDGAALLADPSAGAAQTKEEFGEGQRLRVSGVPHFVIYEESSKKGVQVSGAQPPDEFLSAFNQIARA